MNPIRGENSTRVLGVALVLTENWPLVPPLAMTAESIFTASVSLNGGLFGSDGTSAAKWLFLVVGLATGLAIGATGGYWKGINRPNALGAGLEAIGAGGVLAEPDDLRLLEKGTFVYDALYAWCQANLTRTQVD